MREAWIHTRPGDEDLVRAFRAGDDSAFDHLVERHMKSTYALAYRLTGNHHDADDLAQEAFIRAHRGLARFRGEARFSTWLARIVINLSRNPRRQYLPLTAAPEPASPEPGADLQLVAGQQRQQVRRAITQSPQPGDSEPGLAVLATWEEERIDGALDQIFSESGRDLLASEIPSLTLADKQDLLKSLREELSRAGLSPAPGLPPSPGPA